MALLGLAVALPGAAFAQQKTLKEAIVGTWTITSNYEQREDGKKNDSFGPGVKGQYVFGSDGSYTLTIIGEPRADMKSDDPRRPDAYVIVTLGRYTVDEAKKTLAYKVERAGNSMRNGAETSDIVSISGDGASFAGSARKDQNGTFSPHMETKRSK
jgi:ribosomal protein S16